MCIYIYVCADLYIYIYMYSVFDIKLSDFGRPAPPEIRHSTIMYNNFANYNKKYIGSVLYWAPQIQHTGRITSLVTYVLVNLISETLYVDH